MILYICICVWYMFFNLSIFQLHSQAHRFMHSLICQFLNFQIPIYFPIALAIFNHLENGLLKLFCPKKFILVNWLLICSHEWLLKSNECHSGEIIIIKYLNSAIWMLRGFDHIQLDWEFALIRVLHLLLWKRRPFISFENNDFI